MCVCCADARDPISRLRGGAGTKAGRRKGLETRRAARATAGKTFTVVRVEWEFALHTLLPSTVHLFCAVGIRAFTVLTLYGLALSPNRFIGVTRSGSNPASEIDLV